MRKIWLSNVRKYTFVDDEDYEHLIRFTWHLNGAGYVTRNEYVLGSGRKNCKYLLFSMARVVMEAQKGEVIDHVDRNKRNNQKNNLRKCTQKENTRNRGANCNNSTGYKGVTKMKSGSWRSRLRMDGETIYLGYFDSPEKAARAYNVANRTHNKEFSFQNVIKRASKRSKR